MERTTHIFPSALHRRLVPAVIAAIGILGSQSSQSAVPHDFNHDGKPDYLLYNATTHQTAIWYLNNNNFVSGALAPTLPPGWSIAGVADFNLDGNLDYCLTNTATRQTAIWYLSGATLLRGVFGPPLPAGWQLVAMADFNADGKPDYVLYNTTTRQTAVWFLNNNLLLRGAFGPTLPSGWRVVGVADFERDAKPDYLLFNPGTRQTAIWYLSGVTVSRGAFGPGLPRGWEVAMVADFNGDGKPDYVLSNSTTRQTAIWYLNNNVYLGGAFGPSLPAGWSLAHPSSTAVNQSPIVNAGPDQTITLPNQAMLHGQAADDGLPNPPGILSYTWSKVSGPGSVTFANAHAPVTTATFSAAGTYVLNLTASDSLLSGSDTIVVAVNATTFLHVVISAPAYVVDYDGSGSEPVTLIGHDSHTHEPGHSITSWTWTEGATLLGRTADITHSFSVGSHTVTLTIGDDNSPPETLSDQVTFVVYPVSAVGGVLTSYYHATSVPVSQLIDALPPSPDFREVLPSLRIDNVAGNIGDSGFSSNVVAVMSGNLHVSAAATYQFTLVGGSATRLFINGSRVSGSIVLQPGSYAIEARFAIDSASLLPVQVLASINGGPASTIANTALTHDETGLKPFINSMPFSGSVQGGETITIAGLGFFPAGSVSVQWGSKTLVAPNISVTPNLIQLVTPPGSGTVAVSVRTPNGVSNSVNYSYIQAGPITFAAPATVATLMSPTQAAWGPDGRLYVATNTGNINIYTFSDDYTVTNTQVVTTVATLPNKAIMGLAFNPLDPPSPVKMYIGHSQLYANGGGAFTGSSAYNGQVSVLTGPNFNSLQPLITGLPVSNHDHAVNGMTFDNNGDLLIANGGNTNAGIPSDAMGTLPESPLSGAILKARLSKPGFNGTISYVETATGRPNNDQVFGDRVDVVPGVDVSVYVPGLRNPWDIVWSTRGILYGSDNGADPTFGNSSTSATTQGPPPDAPDEINHLVEGHYYGHPNRNRGRYDDRQNVYHFPTNPETFASYNGSPMSTILSSSNGIDEYRATTFGSQMRGNLLVQKWSDILYRAALAPDGRSVQSVTKFGSFLGLDVVAGPGGAILSIDYSRNKIVVLKPIDNGAPSMVAYDIFPWRALADGSATFTIGGAGFGSLGATSVKIGGIFATVTSVSPTRIKGIIPANAAPTAQLLDVVVQSAGKTSIIPQAFRYMQGAGKGVGIWTTGPAVPVAVGEVAAGVVNGVLYLVGEGSNLTLAYDLKAGTWRSNLAQRPRPGNHHAAEVINGKLYLFGGLSGGSEGRVQIYNPITDNWTLGTPAPYAAGSASTALINGKVYMAGGIVGSSTVATAAVYNPSTNTWSSIAPMPIGVNHAASSTDGQKLYIFGGRSGGNVPSIGFNYVQIYDPATNTWATSFQPGSTIPPLPQARGGMGKAVYYGNEFYIMGGETTAGGTGQLPGNVYDRVDVYNAVTTTWRREAAMPTARHGIFPVTADGRIFVAGGGIQAGYSNSSVFEIFSR